MVVEQCCPALSLIVDAVTGCLNDALELVNVMVRASNKQLLGDLLLEVVPQAFDAVAFRGV